MSFVTRTYLVANIVLPPDASFEEAFSVSRGKLRKLGICESSLEYKIYRRSIDARNKRDIKLVYSIAVSGDLPPVSSLKKYDKDVSELVISEPVAEKGDISLKNPIVIVGSGPCGMFSALFLAENGYKPIIIERGGSISERLSAVDRFCTQRNLDTDTNIQFGAGGAGTFSDGKLVTRINDPYSSYVLKKLVEFGAPKEILYMAKPHVGTDILSGVVERILERIKQLGGKVMYHTRLEDIKANAGHVTHAVTNRGDIACDALVLAIGHSARDTYSMLMRRSFAILPKQFSVGMRIEHKTIDIDRGMYGDMAGHSALGHAEYNLSYNTKQRGVYTFCMCPGGIVVPAASEQMGVVTNGMSFHKRNGDNSNSAVVCSVFKEDYGNNAASAIDFQRRIEKAAFKAGGGDYSAPIVTVGDFLNDRCVSEPTEVLPSYMGGGVRLASPKSYLPEFVTENIKNAILDFGRKLPGFSSSSALLTGAETRTSAPVRILRSSELGTAPGFNNVYPAGEGAGYAGGITSAAIDGIKLAVTITKKYKPLQ